MRNLLILTLCDPAEEEKIQESLRYNYNTQIKYYREKDYRNFIDAINDKTNLIIIGESIKDKLYIINRYPERKHISRTIIIDDIKFESYKYIDKDYSLFNILPSNYNQESLKVCIEMIERIDYKDNIPIIQEITNIINKTNISQAKTGYNYIKAAIYESYKNPVLLKNFNKKLYPCLSKLFAKSEQSIEKAIRITINETTTKYNKYNEELFSTSLNYKNNLTNQKYIKVIVNHLLNEYGKIII